VGNSMTRGDMVLAGVRLIGLTLFIYAVASFGTTVVDALASRHMFSQYTAEFAKPEDGLSYPEYMFRKALKRSIVVRLPWAIVLAGTGLYMCRSGRLIMKLLDEPEG